MFRWRGKWQWRRRWTELHRHLYDFGDFPEEYAASKESECERFESFIQVTRTPYTIPLVVVLGESGGGAAMLMYRNVDMEQLPSTIFKCISRDAIFLRGDARSGFAAGQLEALEVPGRQG